MFWNCISIWDVWLLIFIYCCFLTWDLGSKYRQDSTEFLVNFQKLEILESVFYRLSCDFRFQTGYDIVMPYKFLDEFRKIKTHSKKYDDCHVSISKSRRNKTMYANILKKFKPKTQSVWFAKIQIKYQIYKKN